MDQNQMNTTSGPKKITGSPRKVVDGDYSSLLQELLGFTSPAVNETAQTMLLANLTEAETISISRIIFGIRTSDAERELVKSVLNDSTIEYVTMRMHHSKYKLTLESAG